MVLELVEQEGHGDDNYADDEESRNRAGVVSEVGVILHVVAHSVAGADHLRRCEEYERHAQTLIAAEEYLLQ